jgi:hypothetical protein
MKRITDEDIGSAECILVDMINDVGVVMKWCVEHPDVCQQIAKNAMQFYEKHFTAEFIYDYVADLCNTFSGMLTEQKDMYAVDKGTRLGQLKPRPSLRFDYYKETAPVSTNNTVIIVPFRDSGDQDRTKQLEQFIEHYKTMNILVVEQSKDQMKFNRGMLLNIGYDYLCRELPEVTSFVVHDVDILMSEEIVDHYYGDDGKDLVHLGRLIKRDKYESKRDDQFLGRVLRISKTKYKQLNGFPNTFYGWGGEDDALARRIGTGVVFRPKEPPTGMEMETKNDIFTHKRKDQMEANKVEQLILDNVQWKIDGVNSLQYAIEENKAINSRVRKITVQLNPVKHALLGEMVIRTPKDASILDTEEPHDGVVLRDTSMEDPHEQTMEHDEPDTDVLEAIDKNEVLEVDSGDTKVISTTN